MDNHRNNIEMNFADAGLALLMDLSAEADGELLWEEYCSDDRSMPQELDIHLCNHIQKTIAKHRKRKLITRMLKSACQIAASLAIILFLTFSLITSVEALRVPVLNFILKHSERATAIIFQQASTQKETQLEELLNILKNSVPEGYILEAEHIYRDKFSDPPVITSVFLGFLDADDNLLAIHVTPAEGTMNVDTENASVTQITLEGQYAMLIEKAPEISVIWINETQELLYSISSNSMEMTDFMEYVTKLAEKVRYSNAGLSE